MHGSVPLWVLLVTVGPVLASFLLFVGMLFSSRTRNALLMPAGVFVLVLAVTSIAVFAWKSDTVAPILIFAGPWIILVATVVALARALRQ